MESTQEHVRTRKKGNKIIVINNPPQKADNVQYWM